MKYFYTNEKLNEQLIPLYPRETIPTKTRYII